MPTENNADGLGRTRLLPSGRLQTCLLGLVALTWLVGIVLLWSAWPAGIRQLATSAVASYLLAWSLVFIVSRQPRSVTTARFLLMSVALGLVVFVGELTSWIGLIDYRAVFGTYAQEPWARPTERLDPELLHIHRPHTRLRISGPARGDIAVAKCLPLAASSTREYEIVYDRNGFRNRLDRDAVDIAVIGDSFLEAGPDSELLPALLEGLNHVSVANLGQSWYGPQQELVVLKRYAVLLRPRIIVWTFFEGNDLRDVHRYNTSREQWEAISRRLQSPWMRSFGTNALLALHRLGKHCEPAQEAIVQSGLFRTAGGDVRMYFGKAAQPLSGRDRNALEQVRLVFQEAHELSRHHRFHLMVLFIPMKFRVYSDLIRCEPDPGCADWVLNDLPQRLGRLLKAVSPAITYVDLTPHLAAEARKGVLVYPLDDTHWSPAGHRVAAAVVSERLAHVLVPR